MKSKALILLICIQSITAIFLFFQIRDKYKNTLGVSISPINSNTIVQTPSGGLKYFNEPKANTVEEVTEDWLTHKPKYTINNDSLNERFDYPVKKEKSVFRIITLGDSFTFGANIDTKDNYSEQLEDLLHERCSDNKTYEVINLGVRGYDVQYMNERYQKRGAKYKPDLVIALIGDFQLFRLKEEMGKLADDLKEAEPELDRLSITIKVARELVSNLGWSEILKRQKTQIKRLVDVIDSKIVIIGIPHNNIKKYTWYETVFEGWPFVAYNNFLKEMTFYKKDTFFHNFIWKNDYALKDGHPNLVGHTAIAEDIFQYLTKNNLIPCSQYTNR